MTDERPLASVIVLGWNGRQYLEDCLSSVLDQDLPRERYEVLYVDNGSVDGSADLVRERFPELPLVTLDHNYGYAEGNNIAYGHTRGEVIVFLNQDTVVHRSWLRELIDGVRCAPDVMAAHANIIQPWYPEFADVAGRTGPATAYTAEVTRLGYVHYRQVRDADRPIDTLFLHGVCIALRRDLAQQLDYIFDPDYFAYAEDLDLGLRVRALGYRSVLVPKSIVYHKHTLETKQSFPKVVRIIRNRYLSFYKVMSGWEFALMVPLLTVGAPLNAMEFGLSWPRRLFYAAALVPATAVALAVTLFQLPKFAAKRRWVRSRSVARGSWCLRALWQGARA